MQKECLRELEMALRSFETFCTNEFSCHVFNSSFFYTFLHFKVLLVEIYKEQGTNG